MRKELEDLETGKTVRIEKSETGLDRLRVQNRHAEALIYPMGANLVHFRPKGEEDLIFGGRECLMHADKTLHAGIPVCWPWFGPHPGDPSKPQHGFARNKEWDVSSIRQLSDGRSEIALSLKDDADTHELFGFRFQLELRFTIGRTLRMELETFNEDQNDFVITQALHSYFLVSDIENVTVRGLENTAFADLTDNGERKTESAPLRIDKVINRVYEPSQSRCIIEDSGFGRKIIIDKEGSGSTTVWNPGPESGLHDLPGDLYRKFVCVETCNAHADSITVKSGSSHVISHTIWTEAQNI